MCKCHAGNTAPSHQKAKHFATNAKAAVRLEVHKDIALVNSCNNWPSKRYTRCTRSSVDLCLI